MREKNGKTTYYVYGLGLISEETNGKTLTYHFDLRGSTIAITDEDGNITDKFIYDAYGSELSREGSTDTPFRYCGAYGVQTDDNGLVYMRSRYYCPTLCRFISEDSVIGSIDKSTSLNRYAFCGGNPIIHIDPNGEAWYHWAIGAAIVVGAAVAVVATAGGAAPALMAVAAVASGTTAATKASGIAAGAFIGSASAFGFMAIDAAYNSTSFKDFNEQGNWGTVLGTGIGGVIGSIVGYFSSRNTEIVKSKLKMMLLIHQGQEQLKLFLLFICKNNLKQQMLYAILDTLYS